MINNSDTGNSSRIASDLLDTISRILNKAAAIEKQPVDIGHGVLLYASEVHLIDMAGRYPEAGISQIAARLGITKGAVSQTAKKLEEKGYIERANREGDKKSVIIRLTERGKDAFYWHSAYHEMVNQDMIGQVSKLSRRDIENVFQFLCEWNVCLTIARSKKKISRQFVWRSPEHPDEDRSQSNI
jgi:DNA-binding MarR family transcriptional regulator